MKKIALFLILCACSDPGDVNVVFETKPVDTKPPVVEPEPTPVPTPTPVPEPVVPTPTPTPVPEPVPIPEPIPEPIPIPEPELTMADEMLKVHNTERALVKVPALVWSDLLVEYSQDWANKLKDKGCKLEHSLDENGENLFWTSGGFNTATEVTGHWVSEKKDYDYATNKCKSVCGHYTQIVWRKTTEVGCARVTCDEAKKSEIWVCKYAPAGNIIGQRPY